MKILFPTDYSPNACNAFEFACYLAEKMKAELTLLHVYPLPLIGGQSNFNPAQAEEYNEKRLKQFVQDYKMHLTILPIDKISIAYKAVHGDTVETIHNRALEGKYDLVIMGTKGETSNADISLGSITSNVIKNIEIPVLAIPATAKYHNIEKVALAEDFDEVDKKPIKMVKEIVNLFDASLSVLHIAEVKDNINNLRTRNYYTIKHQYVRDLDNVNFDLVHGDDKVLALDEFMKQEKVDLLVMVKRNDTNENKKKGLINEMALHTTVPLLAFPDNS